MMMIKMLLQGRYERKGEIDRLSEVYSLEKEGLREIYYQTFY